MPPRSTRIEVQLPPRAVRMPADRRREQLIEVAQGAFARGGYRGTTTLEIGREAGVSEKLVLKHFGNKEGLFRAAVLDPLLDLLARHNEEARARLASSAPDGSPEEAFVRVHAFLSTWAALIRERAGALFAFIADLREFPDAAARLAALFEEQVAESTAILAPATQHPAFRPFDPRVAFLAALGAATAAALTSDDPEGFLDEYLKITLFGVLSEEGRAAFAPASGPITHETPRTARHRGDRKATAV